MDPLDLFISLAVTLDRLQIPYFVTGSVAAAAFGDKRYTADIDVVVRLKPADAEALCACFPEQEFYISIEAVRDAIARAGQFNVLHPASGYKIDFVVSAFGEFDRARFDRAIGLRMPSGEQVRFASPEDVMLKKLEYFRAGGSDKHLRDISSMLRVLGGSVDRDYIERWAARLGVEAEWQLASRRCEAREGGDRG